jgi:hypothetical protein
VEISPEQLAAASSHAEVQWERLCIA